MGKPAPTVVVASDDPVLLDEIVRHLEELPSWHLAGWARTTGELQRLLAEHAPDAALVSTGLARQLDPARLGDTRAGTSAGAPANRSGTRLVVVATEQDGEILRCALRLGAGFVLWPQERDDLRPAVEAAMPAPASGRHRLVAVWGPKGGSGATTLAAHLAGAAASAVPCMLVDLDLRHGDQRVLLGAGDHPRSILDLLAAGEDIPATAVRGVAWDHPAGFSVVLAPARLSAPALDGGHFLPHTWSAIAPALDAIGAIGAMGAERPIGTRGVRVARPADAGATGALGAQQAVRGARGAKAAGAIGALGAAGAAGDFWAPQRAEGAGGVGAAGAAGATGGAWVAGAVGAAGKGRGIVVVDLPSGLGRLSVEVAGRADATAIVVTPDLLALRRARDASKAVGEGPEVGVILNRWSRGAGVLTPGDVEAVLALPVWANLPAQAGLLRAPDLGRLSRPACRALRPLAARLAAGTTESQAGGFRGAEEPGIDARAGQSLAGSQSPGGRARAQEDGSGAGAWGPDHCGTGAHPSAASGTGRRGPDRDERPGAPAVTKTGGRR